MENQIKKLGEKNVENQIIHLQRLVRRSISSVGMQLNSEGFCAQRRAVCCREGVLVAFSCVSDRCRPKLPATLAASKSTAGNHQDECRKARAWEAFMANGEVGVLERLSCERRFWIGVRCGRGARAASSRCAALCGRREYQVLHRFSCPSAVVNKEKSRCYKRRK